MAITPRISEVGSFQFIRPGRNSDEPLTDQLARTPDSRLKAATNSPLQHSSSADDGTYREPVNRTLWQSDQSWTRFAGSLNDTEVINGVSPEGREQLVSASDSLNIPKDFRPGAVLTDLLARGVEAFSSTSGRYAYADDGVRPALKEVGSVRLKYGYQEEKFSLKLTTNSGKELTLNLTHQSGWGQNDDGRALEVDQWLVDFSLDESLSKEEQEEALQLASSLDKLARRYLANGMLDLENLGLDKLQQFSAVSLDLKGAGGESSDLLRIEYRNDDEQNYQYIETEARATEVTSLRYEDFTLQHASQQSQNEWHERRRTYVLGSLDSDVSEGDKNQDITDFTEAAILAEREQQQQLLDDLLGSRIPQPWQR